MNKNLISIASWLRGDIPQPILTGGNYRHPDVDKSSSIKKVFNDGQGRLVFIEKGEDGTIYVNTMLVTNAERKALDEFKPVYVALGYPDYYSHGLESIYKKRQETEERV